ncbi:hypothetical protein [Streptomyces sp. TP-A0356]|uniref:hypothetical protein n=1 Tax=Streptomyces sp. TP-A0356 TaxID=1359208 RepID=UPI000A68BF86|nr:hypothetical protein [Streptomyces sp. TP-A0356]
MTRTNLQDRALGTAMSAPSAAAKKLIGLITVVNGWNRLMVGRRIPPGGCTP